MAVYRYRAMDIYSKKSSGKMEAEDESALRKQLKEQELFLLDAKEVQDNNMQKRMSDKDCADLCRQLGTMLNSGISLISAMSIMTRRESNKRIRKIYRNVYIKLQQGYPMSRALSAQKGVFSPLMINMVRAAESSGSLDKTFLKLSDQFSRDNKLSEKVKSAMLYPIILLIVTIIVMLVVFTVILPNFFNVFNGYHIPTITKVMFGISKFFKNYWYWVVVLILSIIAAISYSLRISKIRLAWDHFKVTCPKVKDLIRVIYTARFARSLSSLYSAGISMISALTLARKTVNNTYIDGQFDNAIKDIRDGSSLSHAMDQIDGFDPKLSSSIYIGEETGRLDDMLDSIARDFDFDAEIATEKLITVLQPLMIILLGFLIGLVILSVMLPLYSLYGSIGG